MKQQLVVVGNGMAGVACVEQILKLPHDFEITIFGDETHVNYNRILLSSGARRREVRRRDRHQRHRLVPDATTSRRAWACEITGIDRDSRVVIDEDGGDTAYDKLILATGSSAFIPPIPGVDKKNVHVFRTLDDTRALLEKSRPGLKGRGDRRRTAGPRSRSRPAGAGLRRDRRPP